MWHEGIASQGSTGILSSLYKYYKKLETKTRIKTMSDACGGQNRNFPMARFHLYIVNALPNVQTVEMHFMESGHSYLTNDRDFSFISKAQNKTDHIFTPSNSFEPLKDIVINRQKNENVKWLKIKWMKFQKGSLKMEYKYDFSDDDFKFVDFVENGEIQIMHYHLYNALFPHLPTLHQKYLHLNMQISCNYLTTSLQDTMTFI